MFARNTAVTALILAGFMATAHAQSSSIEVTSRGEEFHVAYHGKPENLVGGGGIAIQGLGENARYLHAANAPAEPRMVPNFVGQGENGAIVYTPEGQSGFLAAGIR